MSRTDKDRPYWVMLNDDSLSHRTRHDHRHLGEPVYRNKFVLDENGDRIPEPVYVTSYRLQYDKAVAAGLSPQPFFYWGKDWFLPLNLSSYGARTYFGRYPEHRVFYRKDKVYSHDWYKTVRVLAHYVPDHCTEGAPAVGRTHQDNNPCYRVLVGRRRYERAQWLRSELVSEDRRIARDRLRNYTKLANSVEDWEEVEDDNIPDVIRYRRVWWD